MSFVVDMKKNKFTNLLDLIRTSTERREELDKYIAELRWAKRFKLKNCLEKIVGT